MISQNQGMDPHIYAEALYMMRIMIHTIQTTSVSCISATTERVEDVLRSAIVHSAFRAFHDIIGEGRRRAEIIAKIFIAS